MPRSGWTSLSSDLHFQHLFLHSSPWLCCWGRMSWLWYNPDEEKRQHGLAATALPFWVPSASRGRTSSPTIKEPGGREIPISPQHLCLSERWFEMGYLTSAAPSGQQRLLQEWVLRLDNVQVCILIFEGPLALRWILLTAQMDASLSHVSEETARGLWLSTWNGSCVLPKDRGLPALSASFPSLPHLPPPPSGCLPFSLSAHFSPLFNL